MPTENDKAWKRYSAERRASLWRKEMHEDDDDIQIFETKI